MRQLLVGAVLLFASRAANAECVIHGARPTVPLPTMAAGQEFSFIASPDCETLRFTIRGTTVSKIPKSVAPLGPGPRTYKAHLTESEWDAVVAMLGSTLTWVVTGRTSAGVTTRMVTTNELTGDGGATTSLSRADAKIVGGVWSVSDAGDVDGDGRDDVLMGDIGYGAYLFLGPVSGTRDRSRADATLLDDYLGGAVSGAGDVDGDGHDDLLVGAGFIYNPADLDRAAYLVLGPVTGEHDLDRFADAELWQEEYDDYAGNSVSDAGDVDGDGHDDLLVGAYRNNEGAPLAGAAYLLLGPVTGTLDLAVADAKLVGEEEMDFAGACVSGAGDVNADGLADVLVGASWNGAGRGNPGAAYLVLGPVTGTLDLSLADAKLVGEDGSDQLALVADAGDVDGDGHDDVFAGANIYGHPDGPGYAAGAAYLVLGPVTGTLNVSRADAKLIGEDEGDYAALVSGAGDVDGNGHDDLLVGAEGANAAYLVLGPVTGTHSLSRADAKLVGEEEGDGAGWSVSGAGDVDADGHADVVVAAPYALAGYLVYGGGL
jgi:hypothetical protein